MTRRRLAASGADVLAMDGVYRNAKRGRRRSGHGNLERRMRMQNVEKRDNVCQRATVSSFCIRILRSEFPWPNTRNSNRSEDEPILEEIPGIPRDGRIALADQHVSIPAAAFQLHAVRDDATVELHAARDAAVVPDGAVADVA